MFTRMNQITAIRQEIDRTLSHPAWKEFKSLWDRDDIGDFLDKRERAIFNNPFLRGPNGFDAREETPIFLYTRIEWLVRLAADRRYFKSERYRNAAAELARILGVPVPPFVEGELQGVYWRGPGYVPPPAPPAAAEAKSLPHARQQAPQQEARQPTQADVALLPRPWDEESPDERKLAAMERIINDRAAPLGEKLAAQAAYLRLRQKVRGY
jgi:hypothetical protein